MVHASVRGGHADIPTMLATMSIIKDIERVGDYAKQLLRLARVRGSFVPDTAEHGELTSDGNRIAAHLSNILTSIVMPVDKLDDYDGSHATTGSP